MPIHVAVLAVFVLYSVPPEHRPVVGIQDVLPLPMVCYDFDGQQTDATGNYDLVGSPTYYTDGHLGQAVLSSLNLLQADQNGELSPPQITVSFWFQVGEGVEANVARLDGANTPWRVSFVDGSLYWSISGADDEILLEELPTDNNWHHLVLWADGAELGVQLDGATPITQTQNLPIPMETTNLVVAELVEIGELHLDMLRVWNHALTANERLADYNNDIGVSCQFLFTPTAVAISSFSVILPSGGRGELIMGMTAGDLVVAASLITLLAVVTFDLVRRLVRSGSL